ncbi:hypothetical protein FBY37_3856 [Streptomyces sp. SLBN-134]|jgi:transcriptional regulator with XRE-family HTH domain|nr:hypothetical protein FBY37_3856 [Streptomyces sp. SLBN-134]
MAPGHVAYGMRASYGMSHITPDHITAWERGLAVPGAHELTALAGALWCAPRDLMGAPRTLREHRIARGIAPEDVARATGIPLHDYLAMEEHSRWTGGRRESALLGAALELPPRALLSITGGEEELARLLTEAVSTRWQAHIREIANLVSLDKKELKSTLRAMHDEYQTLMAATLSRAGGVDAAENGKRYLDEIVHHFWTRLEGG